MLGKDNFTNAEVWKQSNRIRYDISKIIELEDVDFLDNNSELLCLQFFNLDFSENLLDELLKHREKVIFKYLNLEVKKLSILQDWCEKHNYDLKIADVWDAPQLFLNQDLKSYIKNKCSLLKKDYIKFEKDKSLQYKLYDGTSLDLWVSVLEIDKNSWKGQKLCDMKSLDREDLQYVFYLIKEPQNSSLMVAFKGNEPMAYSLWFKADNDIWYAAKWGASYSGRQVSAGIKVLLNHINYIADRQGKNLELDFWGRRNQFYDMLKNTDVKRCHLEIRRHDDK